MIDSVSYASYLSGKEDNPNHISHIWDFRELASRVAQEQIQEIVPTMVEEVCTRVVKEYLESSVGDAINYDINSIASISIKDFNTMFKSEAFSKWMSDAIVEVIKKRIGEISIPLHL